MAGHMLMTSFHAKLSRFGAFFFFEDNAAVIKMILKVRSPTMRHVTYRVALDRYFDRINLDPKIQIKYVDIKHQLADMLTKGNVTRDEWKHLLRLVNLMSFSNFSCSHLSKLTDPRSCRRGWCRKEDQEKWNVWVRNRNQSWVWCRRLSLGPQLHWVRVHLTHQGHSNHKVRFEAHQYGETRSERFEWQHCPGWGNLM